MIFFLAITIATFFNNSDLAILIVSVILFSILIYFIRPIRENYLHIQRVQDSGWGSLALVSVLFYILIYLVLDYPVSIAERMEYVPVALAFCITVISVYIVIYQTVIKNVRIYDATKENELLEAKIALQQSQLKLQDVYYRMAYTDILTGLKNRYAFEEKKDLLVNLEQQENLACLLMDLNDLKMTNDLQGHTTGDAVLRAFSGILQEALDSVNDIYRIGGDEFLVLFSGQSTNSVKNQINQLQQQIADSNNRSDLQISVAMGLAFMDECETTDLNSLIAYADQKMYEDKKRIKGARNLRN